MSMKKSMIAIAMAALMGILSGCASFSAGSAGVRTGIEAATLKYINGDQQRANRVHRITSDLLEIADADNERPIRETLDVIEERARDRIEWARLDEAEALVIHRLIDAARAEVEARIDNGSVDESERAAVRTVLTWVRDIARIAGGGYDVETVGGNAGVAARRATGA